MAFAMAAAAGLRGCAARGAGPKTVAVMIDNFVFSPERLTVKAGTTVDLDQSRRHSAHGCVQDPGVQIKGDGHRRVVLVHILDTGRIRLLLLLASAYDGNHRGRGDDRQRRHAMMLAGAAVRAGRGGWNGRWPVTRTILSRARRFRDAALPHLDEVYTLARYLLRNAADAEDAVQECYLRAFRHFETFRGGADQALAVRYPAQCLPRGLRAAQLRRRGHGRRCGADCGAKRRRRRRRRCCATVTSNRSATLVSALPDAFRETLVLREINDLVVSRNRRDRRRAGRHGDVAAGARPLDAAGGVAGGRGERTMMTCDEARRDVARVARRRARRRTCARGRDACSPVSALRGGASRRFREMRQAMAGANLRFTAPAALRSAYRGGDSSSRLRPPRADRAARCCRGFALGTRTVGGGRRRRDVRGGALGPGSAHPRRRGVGPFALVAGRSSDRRAVERSAHREAVVQWPARRRAAGGRPHGAGLHACWAGGSTTSTARRWRRSSIGAVSMSSICSWRRPPGASAPRARSETVQGFNVRRWTEQGLRFIAISDINAEELQDFGAKFEAAIARRSVTVIAGVFKSIQDLRSLPPPIGAGSKLQRRSRAAALLAGTNRHQTQ